MKKYKKIKKDDDFVEEEHKEEKDDEEEQGSNDFGDYKHVKGKTQKEEYNGEVGELNELLTPDGWLTDVGREELIQRLYIFIETMCNKQFYEYQKETAENIIREFLLADAEEIVSLYSRQAGKTEINAAIFAGLITIIEKLAPFIKDLEMYKNGLWIGYFAGTGYQVDTLFDRTTGFLEGKVAVEILEELDSKKKTKGKMVRVGQSFIFAKTAAKQSRVESKTYHMICLKWNTEVSMFDESRKKICDIVIGDRILGCDTKSGKIVKDEVINVWNNGDKDCWKIKLETGNEVTATGNHRFWNGSKWVKVRDLRIGDTLSIGYILSKVISINYTGIENVWDITTKNTHSFFSNGIICHNCIDEEQDVDTNMVNKSISPMLSSTGGLLIKSGTPTIKMCELFEACKRTKNRTIAMEVEYPQSEEEYNRTITGLKNDIKERKSVVGNLTNGDTRFVNLDLHKRRLEEVKNIQEKIVRIEKNWKNKLKPRKFYFEVDCDRAGKSNPRYAKYVEKIKDRIGALSDSFLMSYKLVWMIERGMFCSDVELLKCELPNTDLHDSKRSDDIWERLMSGKLIRSWSESKTVASIDWGKTNDGTIATIYWVDWNNPNPEGFKIKRILNWLEIQGDDYTSQYEEVDSFLENYNVGRIIMSSTGVGDPICDRYKNVWEDRCEIMVIKESLQSNSNIYKHLQCEMTSGRWWYPGGSEVKGERVYKNFVNQFKGLEKSWNKGYMVCHHSKSDREAHDDYCSSAGLGCWACREPLDDNIEVEESIFKRRFTQNKNVVQKKHRVWRKKII